MKQCVLLSNSTQMHLIIHLVDEVALTRMAHSRWMFYLERFIKITKRFYKIKRISRGKYGFFNLFHESTKRFYTIKSKPGRKYGWFKCHWCIYLIFFHIWILWWSNEDNNSCLVAVKGRAMRSRMDELQWVKVFKFYPYNRVNCKNELINMS